MCCLSQNKIVGRPLREEKCLFRSSVVLVMVNREGIEVNPMSPKMTPSILTFRAGRLGDTIVAMPALRVLRERFPNHKIVLVTTQSGEVSGRAAGSRYAGAEGPWLRWICPDLVDEIIVVENVKSFADCLRAWRKFATLELDECYILPYYGERDLSLFYKKAWLRILGVSCPVKMVGCAATFNLPNAPFSLQIWAAWRVAVQNYYARYHCSFPKIPISHLPGNECSLLESIGKHGRYLVAYPSSTHAFKRWSVEKMAAVCDQIARREQLAIVVVGAGSDRAVSETFSSKLVARAFNSCGLLSLNETVQLISRAVGFLGNDGGLAHVAASLGVKTVTIISGVHPAGVWDPSGLHSKAVRNGNVECVGCKSEFLCPLGHSACVSEISEASVLDVWKSVDDIRLVR